MKQRKNERFLDWVFAFSSPLLPQPAHLPRFGPTQMGRTTHNERVNFQCNAWPKEFILPPSKAKIIFLSGTFSPCLYFLGIYYSRHSLLNRPTAYVLNIRSSLGCNMCKDGFPHLSRHDRVTSMSSKDEAKDIYFNPESIIKRSIGKEGAFTIVLRGVRASVSSRGAIR